MPEYHIAEWYGRPFERITPQERIRLANHRVTKPAINKQEIERLMVLEQREALGALTAREEARLDVLREKLRETMHDQLPCPFKTGPYSVCTKRNGVCSLRLYEEDAGAVQPVVGNRGNIRALCPFRLHQDGVAFRQIGELILDDPDPLMAGEVGFLEGDGGLDMDEGEDVGRIDMIIVKNNAPVGWPMEWAAAEVQAVYFSGAEMAMEGRHVIDNHGDLVMPVGRRKPDYRSSGVKRLMPQLQTKIPALRRWGRKMAIIVDRSFYENMGAMRPIDELSNADIAWILMDFDWDPAADMYRARVGEVVCVTLESAIEGLTGGRPVSKAAFEDRIRGKILP
ncbi:MULTISPECIES: NotI family restriction endonuclease [unclassified Paracoccus (in: a-proteobacteria)]|uniref:NotI family restriction endonuclease n=1 Tax=unclassified Paracoccus (in: a-proteobacteria) TaxID=2688777 RepID=UPI001FFE16D4|nr:MULTISPECIES: NotI family restriction endonuclease [unclassified Paracoccus (in: a-proteobacteria)]